MLSQVTLSGVTFNDNDNFIITSVPGLSAPNHRRSSYDLPGGDGGVFDNAKYGRRRFSLRGMVIGTSVEDYLAKRDALSSSLALYKEAGTIGFVRSDGIGMTIEAGLVDQFDFDPQAETPLSCEFNLPFEAVSPFLKADYQVAVTISPYQPGGGAVPATVPMSLGVNVGGSAFIPNYGTAVVNPTVTFVGPVVNPGLRNLTTNQEMVLNLTLLDGESVTVNFERHTVLDSFGQSRRDAFSGDWWDLPIGVNEVAFVISSTTGAPTAEVKFVPNYISL